MSILSWFDSDWKMYFLPAQLIVLGVLVLIGGDLDRGSATVAGAFLFLAGIFTFWVGGAIYVLLDSIPSTSEILVEVGHVVFLVGFSIPVAGLELMFLIGPILD